MHSFRDHAIALARDGFRVFPLAPGKKIPALDMDWRRIATADPDAVHALWTCPVMECDQPFNIGIATGDGLVVLDVDVKDGVSADQRVMMLELNYEELPATRTVETPSGGRHYYFNTNAQIGNSSGKIAPHVDVRGENGFVVAPGSRINTGAGFVDYRRSHLDVDRPNGPRMADLPDAYREAVQNNVLHANRHGAPGGIRSKGGAGVTLNTVDALDRAKSYLKHTEPAIEGAAGDNRTIVVANRVLDFGVSVDTAHDLMLDHWNDRCSPPWSPDDLMTKIANAAKSRQSPIGVASPEAEFEAVDVIDRRSKPKRAKLYYERWREAHESTGAPYLIKGWYDLGAMVVTYGESNSGKTNVVLSQAFAIASGQAWGGARARSGLVVYVAAEGGAGVRKRISALNHKYGAADIPFALVPCPVDLLRPAGDTKALIDLVKAAEADFDQRCVMVVLDTLSRVLAGGNENAPDDMGALVIHCDRIREATGATVHLIHHSGKNTAAGARGHSSLRAATDTEIEIANGQIMGKKQRDMERMSALSFQYEKVTLGTDQDGDAITSIVTHIRKGTEFEMKVTGQGEQMLDMLIALHDDLKGEEREKGVLWRDWQKACLGYVTTEEKKPVERTHLFRIRRNLYEAGVIRKSEARRWVPVNQ